MKLGWGLVLAIGVTACASPQQRLETGLVDAGIAAPRAACMADFLSERLSISQLGRLKRIKVAGERVEGESPTDYYLRIAEALDDPEVALAVGGAVLACPTMESAEEG